MTISSQTRKAGPFVGNDSTTAFPFAFKVFSAADMYVVKTDTDLEVEMALVLNTDYTVSLNADQNASPGGTITLPTALATGFTLTVTSNISPLQQTDLTNQGGFYPSVITNALDKLTILIQQALDSIGRSLKLPVSTPSGVSTTLPLPSSNKLIGWNQDADGLQNVDPTTLATIVAFGTANADVFDGDGVTTQFALSANPGALGNLDVSIGGVTQTPGVDYTWTSGTVITFTSAPPVGTDNVLVRYMQGLPQGYTDSAASTFIQSGSGAVSRTAQDKGRESVSPEDFGAAGNGTTEDSAAVALALTRAGSGVVKFTSGKTYLLSGITLPDGCTVDATGVTFKKAADGYIFSVGKRCRIIGKPTFDGNYSGGKTGNSIVIAVGDNSATPANQGRQDITATFTNSDQYHVAYTAANKGWLSRLLFCDFTDLPANSPANVLWPDEPANGGNRSIIGGYSAGPVCNVNGCDNGLITKVQIGGNAVPGLNEGVYFPNGTTNGAKKIIMVANRLGISGGRMQIRGSEHQFKDNIVAGDVYLMNGVAGCSIGGNVLAAGYSFVDQSLGVNYISGQPTITVTPSIVSGITLGNGSITAEYARVGDRVEFTITLTLGSTTSITGSMTFGLPFPVYSGNTTRYIGQVWGTPGYTGIAYIETGAQQITIYNTASAAVWNASIPKVWANGDVIRITGSYRI